MSLFNKTENDNTDPKMQDPLTGLKNRNYFHEVYGELGPVDSDDIISIAVFDIDHFKAANDLIDGDKAILNMISILQSIIKDRGEVLRWGGDEFVILLNTDPNESLTLLEEFVERVEEETPVTVSVGLVKVRHEDIFKRNYYRAVQKCYLVKEMGGNGIKL